MEERTITLTKKQLVEANARACSNAVAHTSERGLDEKAGVLFVMTGAILNAELIRVLFPDEEEKNDAEEKLADSLKGDAK